MDSDFIACGAKYRYNGWTRHPPLLLVRSIAVLLCSLLVCTVVVLYCLLSMVERTRMNADQLEDVLGPFPCVRLRGLPFEATIDDVLRFFQGQTRQAGG